MSDLRALGFKDGWGTKSKLHLNHCTSQIAWNLGCEAAKKSSKTWTLAFWKVRIAMIGAEKAKAVAGFSAAQPAVESVSE